MTGAAFGLARDQLTALSRCPDCHSETQTVELTPHVFTVQIFHDDTCPYLRAHQK